MEKGIAFLLFFVIGLQYAFAQRSDQELNRDSVIGWQYVSNPIKPKAVYKPIKSQYANGAVYSAWQQQASDMLISWIQQSYLPRGLVMRTIAKNDERWYVDANGPLQSYGVNFLGYETHFANGKIDLRCCEQGQRLVAGFNDFPGEYVQGFNPDGLYFFAEQAPFTTGDDDTKLSNEGVDKKIQPNVYPYRTYLDHYHNSGVATNKMGIVIAKNGDWPFKAVLVKDAVAYINQQLAAYPSILQKNPYSAERIKKALERLKPYYNEFVKLKSGFNYHNAIQDDNGHYLLDPDAIINGHAANKTFPEYNILVSTTQQTIDQTKRDVPLWVYFNFTPMNVAVEENLKNFDRKFGTGVAHMVNALLNNINYNYVYQWLSNPDKMKDIAYTPVNAPAKASGITGFVPATVSANTTAKNKDLLTVLYEDFEGYPDGAISSQKWHTAGYGFANSSLTTLSGQNGKWVSIPQKFTFYPDLISPLPQNYTISYDVYFGPGITNKRVMHYFRIDAYDPKDKYPQPMNIASAVDKGTDFGIAMSGETTLDCKFRNGQITEMYKEGKLPAFKEKDIAHVTISVNGPAISVSVNGKEITRNDQALPAGKSFKRIGWYCSAPGIGLSNIYIRNGTDVPLVNTGEPQFAGVVKSKENHTSQASTFETIPYVPQQLPKLNALPPINYPAGFKSTAPALSVSSNTPVAILKMDYRFPVRSDLLNSISNITTKEEFKKNIADIAASVANKLGRDNVTKIDNYLGSKKTTSISQLAIDAWTGAKPTVALYLFCKAVQADYSDFNAINNLAAMLNTYGYSEKAIPILQYINKQEGVEPVVLANLANAYYNLGDFTTADGFASQAINKDSLNPLANKIAAYNHLNKAQKNNNKTEAAKAIQKLKQSLMGKYDKEASDILNKIENNHRTQEDYTNTNFKEFEVLKRITMPAMPEDLHQAKSFNKQLQLEKSSINKTIEEVGAALSKIPKPATKQNLAQAMTNLTIVNMMNKGTMITNETLSWYIKMKSDLEQIFTQNRKSLTISFNKKAAAINKKYNDQMSKLEGGEGNETEEVEMENLKKARCEEYNKEATSYLSDVAKLTNQFAQQSEYVSRIYWRDYANWQPYAQLDDSYRPFLYAQRSYLVDVTKIMSMYNAVEPCVYPPGSDMQNDNTAVKPKQWEEAYCSTFKGSGVAGATKVEFDCNKLSISGGEGWVGSMDLTYNEDGTFKELTIGAGVGANAQFGNDHISSISASATAMEYITIGAAPGGLVQVTDWGINAGISAGGNVSTMSTEANIISTRMSVQSGITVSGAVPDGLGLK